MAELDKVTLTGATRAARARKLLAVFIQHSVQSRASRKSSARKARSGRMRRTMGPARKRGW